MARADRAATAQAEPVDPWADAQQAAALLAVDPTGLGGAVLRARHGPQRTLWLGWLRALLPAALPMRRAPLAISDERLLGGLDLPATLQAGRPVALRGLLAECHGGLVQLALAERLSAGTAARLAAVLDQGEVRLERDGLAQRLPARIGLIALDEGIASDEATPAALTDRLALWLTLDGLPPGAEPLQADTTARVMDARQRLPRVQCNDDTLTALCGTALLLGVQSLRAPLLAVRVARAAAALRGQPTVGTEDVALAVRLVLAQRATRLPTTAEESEADAAGADPGPAPPPEPAAAEPPESTSAPEPGPSAEDPPPPQTPQPETEPRTDQAVQPMADQLLAIARGALPPDLLARLQAGLSPRSPASGGGRAGALNHSGHRGRPTGSRRGSLRQGQRLDLLATLRGAAPWQGLRRREALAAGRTLRTRLLVQPDDFHLRQHVQRRETTTVFLVDASGSAAMHRLAEAKGAVQQLLADCYVRRDRVALLVFRGTTAELVLPPTRSLVRAKRALAGQPGGGGTPLAHGLDAAAALAATIVRGGGTPVLVLLTDGRANINRAGQPGRPAAMADALASAQALRSAGVATLLVDTAPPSADAGPARALADALGAVHLPLPQMDASRLSRAAQAMATA